MRSILTVQIAMRNDAVPIASVAISGPRRQRDAVTSSDRPHQIELLFDAERPEVQQRLQVGGDVEVARLLPEREVGRERGAGGDVTAEARIVVGIEQEPAGRSARRASTSAERREDAADAARVEIARS